MGGVDLLHGVLVEELEAGGDGFHPMEESKVTILRMLAGGSLNTGKGEWRVDERTTFMEYLCNKRS